MSEFWNYHVKEGHLLELYLDSDEWITGYIKACDEDLLLLERITAEGD